MEDRLVVHFKDAAKQIQEILGDFHALLASSRMGKLLGAESIAYLKKMQALILDRMHDKFTLVVIGDFKRGKSTLINALLGQPVTAVNTLPETVTINRIAYGDEKSAELVMANGKRYRLAEDELSREKLEPIIRELNGPVDHMEITAPCRLLNEVTIVDTPGLNDIQNIFDERVREYLHKADAILFVTSAISPLSQSERNFIASTLPQECFKSMFVVVNQCDCLDDLGQISRISNLILNRVSSIRGDIPVYPVSALHTFSRRMSLPVPNDGITKDLDDCFDRFEAALRDEILARCDIIQCDRLFYAFNQYLNAFEGRIRQLDGMLQKNADALNDAERKCREEYEQSPEKEKRNHQELAMQTDLIKSEAIVWMEEFMNRLHGSLEGLAGENADTLEKHLQFFVSDAVRDAAEACIAAHQDRMEELVQSLAGGMGFDIRSLGDSVTATVQMEGIQWTKADSAMFVFDYGAQMAGMEFLALPAYVIGGVMRKKQQQKERFRLLDSVLANFGELSQFVFTSVGNAYDQFCRHVLEALSKRMEEELSASLEALKHAQEIKRSNDISSEQVREGFDGAIALILDARDRIHQMQN